MDDCSDRILTCKLAGLSCSQTVMKLVGLEPRGEEGEALIAAMGGLSYGMLCQHTCGCLTGAACALALYEIGYFYGEHRANVRADGIAYGYARVGGRAVNINARQREYVGYVRADRACDGGGKARQLFRFETERHTDADARAHQLFCR